MIIMKISLPIIIAAVVIIAAVLFLVLQNHGTTTQTTQSPLQSLMAIRLTDPPTVPNGTTSLVISYSKVGVHLSNAQNSSGWLYANSSGTLNLLSILNVSQTIGAVSVPVNSSIESVRFSITSASITVNGTTYNVTVPSQTVTAHVAGQATLNGTGSLLMSLSPVVATILTANSTVFVMVPSLRAVIVGQGTNSSSVKVGYVARLNQSERKDLADVRPNITVSNASVSVQGNSTTISVTVTNNENQTASIRHISVFGNLSVALNTTGIQQRATEAETELSRLVANNSACTGANTTTKLNTTAKLNITTQDRPELGAGANVSVTAVVGQNNGSSERSGGNASVTASSETGSNKSTDNTNQSRSQDRQQSSGEINNSDLGNFGEDLGSSYNIRINGSICTAQGLSEVQSRLRGGIFNTSAVMQKLQTRLGMVSLLVLSNGTVMSPSNVEDFNETGYVLAAGSSHTFTFSGRLARGESNLLTTLVAGSGYHLVVTGESDAHASINVTAS